jgi:hypothetical protein
VRGRKAARRESPRPVRMESTAVTSEPYTGASGPLIQPNYEAGQ